MSNLWDKQKLNKIVTQIGKVKFVLRLKINKIVEPSGRSVKGLSLGGVLSALGTLCESIPVLLNAGCVFT